jgi:hypothetical protein
MRSIFVRVEPTVRLVANAMNEALLIASVLAVYWLRSELRSISFQGPTQFNDCVTSSTVSASQDK